ncbi:MAG: hypothetical protein JO189_28975 [Deltaproteobacteria bacterium]|nr:hypothetical protein [Deltaproteobacteria bacterium]
MAVAIENLTERLQRHLGIQQAQTISPEDFTADAIARLLGRRGDPSLVAKLWNEDERPTLVAGYRPREHEGVLAELVRVLDATLVVQREKGSGRPKTFLPLIPELVWSTRAGQLYREMGRTVTEGLWLPTERRRNGFRAELTRLITSWPEQHPLGRLLKLLCKSVDAPSPESGGNFAAAVSSDKRLARWVEEIVTQDWEAYLVAASHLSADEQLEMMSALIGLHAHVALLYRLIDSDDPEAKPVFFIAATKTPDDDRACDRAAYSCFSFWRDQAQPAMRRVAHDIIRLAARQNPTLRNSLSIGNFTAPAVWLGQEIREGGKRKRATREFREQFEAALRHAEERGETPTQLLIENLLVDALYAAFDTASGPVTKVKDYLRNTGRATGIVGPEGTYRRKRYQLDDRALELLLRLHAARGDAVLSDEDEKQSIAAWLDDVAERYGLILTTERERARKRFELAVSSTASMRALRRHFPSEQAMAANRQFLDQRLDELRVVRRFSDASSVVYVG